MRITVSAIKADIGAIGGHTRPSDELLDVVKNFIEKKRNQPHPRSLHRI